MKRMTIVLLGFAGFVSFSAQAQMKPESAIRLRKAAMTLINYNFNSIGAMVSGKKPYDKDEAIRNANRLEGLAPQPFEFFIAGSDQGKTQAKAEIWKEADKFKAAAEKMQVESTKLAQIARTGDMAALKTQFGATSQACDACHDKYREE